MENLEPLYVVILTTSLSILFYYFHKGFGKLIKFFSLLLISFSLVFLGFYFFTPENSIFNSKMNTLNTTISQHIDNK
jgi:hypothetical protein